MLLDHLLFQFCFHTRMQDKPCQLGRLRRAGWRSVKKCGSAGILNLEAVFAVEFSAWGVEADEADAGGHFRRGGARI